jgi:O-antigen/teichoic acid export membrane protein
LALHKIISWNAASRLLSVLFNFLVVLAVSRSLGPVAKGETTLWITVIFIGVFASNIAGGFALINYLKKNIGTKVLLSTYVWSLIACAFVALATHLISNREWHFALHIFVLAAFSSFASANQTLLLSKHHFKAFNFLIFWQPFLLFLSLILMLYVFQTKSIESFLVALYISVLLSFLMSFLFILKSEKTVGSFSLKTLKEVTINGFPFQLAELMQLLHLRLYFFLLAGYDEGGLYRLGVYSVGISILESVWIFSRSVATVNFAATVKHPSALDTLRWLRLSLVFSLIALTAIFAVPKEVYAWVFGEGFLYVKYAVKYLFPGIGFYVFVLVLGSYFMGKEKYFFMSLVHVLGIIISILLCYFLIPDYEMSGAGLAASISFAVSAASVLFYFLQTEKIAIYELLPKKQDFIL